MSQTHCKTHGLKLERMTLEEATKRSLFFRVMRWIQSAPIYDEYGEKRIVLVCPKNDFLISE